MRGQEDVRGLIWKSLTLAQPWPGKIWGPWKVLLAPLMVPTEGPRKSLFENQDCGMLWSSWEQRVDFLRIQK